MKLFAQVFFLLTVLTANCQDSISNEAKNSITAFVKKEVKFLKQFQMEEYYSFFDKNKIQHLFKNQSFDFETNIKKGEMLRTSNHEKVKLLKNTPFDEFYKDFDLHIYTKKQLEEDYSNSALQRAFKRNILEGINPKIKFGKEQYLVFLCPKFKETEIPKYGEFLVLQIIEKQKHSWKVIASIL